VIARDEARHCRFLNRAVGCRRHEIDLPKLSQPAVTWVSHLSLGVYSVLPVGKKIGYGVTFDSNRTSRPLDNGLLCRVRFFEALGCQGREPPGDIFNL